MTFLLNTCWVIYYFAGYYKMPDYSKTVLQITGRSDKIISNTHKFSIIEDNDTDLGVSTAETSLPTETLASVLRKNDGETVGKVNSVGVQTEEAQDSTWEKLTNSNITSYFSREFITFSYGAAKLWLNQQENKGLKLTLIVLVGCIVAMFWYFNAQVSNQVTT